MKFSTVTDTVLIETTLVAKSERVKGASVFPFFCKSGHVKQLMVLLPDFKTVFLIPFKKGLATVSFGGVVKLSMDLAEIKSHSNFTSKQLAHLYHYDPDWHLSHERFAGYWAKNLIKQSNCADSIEGKVQNVMFSKDLSLLKHFAMKSGLINNVSTITPEMLLVPLLPAQSENHDLSIEAENLGWQLNPIWKHWRSKNM
jgi:hypothetical protein